MTNAPKTHDVALGMGLASAVLGTVGLLLFFLPILSIPIESAGMVLGLVGFLFAIFGDWTGLRWSIAGIAVCGLALAFSVAIAVAPAAYVPTPIVPLDTQPVPSHPYIPPPDDHLGFRCDHPGPFRRSQAGSSAWCQARRDSSRPAADRK